MGGMEDPKVVLEEGFSPATITLVVLAGENSNERIGNYGTGAGVVRAEVLARVALGHSNRKIARDLHIGRHTIDAILAQHQSAPLGTTRVARITPLAYDAVENLRRTNRGTLVRSGGAGWSART